MSGQKNLVLLPSLSLFPLPPCYILRLAKTAGFDGVELFLDGRVRRQLPQLRIRAVELGLTLHLHQLWSRQENDLPINRLLDRFGYLPKHGYSLDAHVPDGDEPVVIYANRAIESLTKRLAGRCWWQSVSALPNGRFTLACDKFLALVHQHRHPVVFDTQHYLEYRNRRLGVEHLPKEPAAILDLLIQGWSSLGDCVQEIHLNDFDPRRRHQGGNLFPGTGLAPLRAFCQHVRRQGWHGAVVPEVTPWHLGYSVARLKKLRRTVDALLAP